MQIEHRPSNALKLLYVLLTFLSCMSTYNVNYTKFKLGSVVIAMIGVVYFLIFFNTYKIDIFYQFLKKYMFFIAVMLAVSLIVYVADLSSVDVIKRGVEKITYQMITILAALSTVYIFRKQAIDYTCAGFLLFNFVALLMAVKSSGISAALADFIYFIQSKGDARGFMRLLELHEVIFSYGLFIIYYAYKGLHDKRNFIFFTLCTLFFLLGFKRIGAGGLLLSLSIIPILRKMRYKSVRKLVRIISILLLIIGFLYVIIVQTGLFVRIMNELKIDMMGRQNLYQYINNYYRISPLFLGHGFGSVTRILQSAGNIKINDTTISKLTALHNDYVTMYVEMGFFGFLAWESYFLIYLRQFSEKYGRDVLSIYFLMTVYLFTTYFTDNTALYFLVTIVFRIIPMCVAVSKVDDSKGEGKDVKVM